MRNSLKKAWKSLPSKMRKLIVSVIGVTLILLGTVLIVLPGPFTMPFVILGLVVLAAEFAWAESLLIQVKHHGKKLHPRMIVETTKNFKKRKR